MTYVCMRCHTVLVDNHGSEVQELPDKPSCNVCQYPVLMKRSPPLARKVKAE